MLAATLTMMAFIATLALLVSLLGQHSRSLLRALAGEARHVPAQGAGVSGGRAAAARFSRA